MRLARLRNQMLIAMGVPACWSSSTTEPVATPTPTVAAAPQTFDAARCKRDTIPETVCGRDEERSRCGPRANSLASIDQHHLHVTTLDDELQRFHHYVFDQAASDAYRSELGGDDPKSCCYSSCTALEVGSPEALKPNVRTTVRCIPAPPAGTSLPAAQAPQCPTGVRLDGAVRAFARVGEEGQCCYTVGDRTRVFKGRAARVDGEVRVAPVATGAGWTADVTPCLDGLSQDVRDRLARAWLEAAQTEHASIASFANLATALLAFGAPADLVRAAHAAALDEIEHARIAFAFASAYVGGAKRRPPDNDPGASRSDSAASRSDDSAGVVYGPGELADFRRMRVPATLAELARETFVDGCINETGAAVEAAYAGERAVDPVVAEALHAIAADEARHAELAWAIVAWCVRREGPALVEELRGELAAFGLPATRDADLATHGIAGDPRAWSDAMREVVEPCLAALAA